MTGRNCFVILDHIPEGSSGGQGATIRVGNTGEKGLVGGPDGIVWEQTIHMENRKAAVLAAIALRDKLKRPLRVHGIWKHVEPELYKLTI